VAELAKAAPPAAPAVSPPGLTVQEEIEELLFAIRQAYLDKNLKLYMECLAAGFPNREEKRQKTAEMLMNNEYPRVVFTIDKLQDQDRDKPTALITWNVQVRKGEDDPPKTITIKFKVDFVRENGKLLILAMEKKE